MLAKLSADTLPLNTDDRKIDPNNTCFYSKEALIGWCNASEDAYGHAKDALMYLKRLRTVLPYLIAKEEEE